MPAWLVVGRELASHVMRVQKDTASSASPACGMDCGWKAHGLVESAEALAGVDRWVGLGCDRVQPHQILGYHLTGHQAFTVPKSHDCGRIPRGLGAREQRWHPRHHQTPFSNIWLIDEEVIGTEESEKTAGLAAGIGWQRAYGKGVEARASAV